MQLTETDLTETETQALARVTERAREVAGSGAKAGIAAALVRGTDILCLEENEVHLAHDPTRHAEIVAMARAAEAQGSPDLSGCTLVTSLQPCEMCLSAMRFAGIDRVIFAAQQPNVGPKYFMFPRLRIDDFDRAGDGFAYLGGLREYAVIDLYADEQE